MSIPVAIAIFAWKAISWPWSQVRDRRSCAGGRVFDPAFREERYVSARQLNERIAADERVDDVMLSVRDGVTVARKR